MKCCDRFYGTDLIVFDCNIGELLCFFLCICVGRHHARHELFFSIHNFCPVYRAAVILRISVISIPKMSTQVLTILSGTGDDSSFSVTVVSGAWESTACSRQGWSSTVILYILVAMDLGEVSIA